MTIAQALIFKISTRLEIKCFWQDDAIASGQF